MASLPGLRAFVRYVRSLRAYIAIMLAIFIMSITAGYAMPYYLPEASKAMISGLQGKAGALTGQPIAFMITGIFLNNVGGALMSLLLGLIAGIFPVLFIGANGMTIGIVMQMMVARLGVAVGAAVFLIGILPHGILELPAVLLSSAIGLKLGHDVVLSILKGEDRATASLKEGLLIFIAWVVPALLIAAIIEALVTGALLSYLATLVH